MIKYYGAGEKGLKELDGPQKKCWIYVEMPSGAEIDAVTALTGVSETLLKSALDEEEAAHLDRENNARMIVIDIPKMVDHGDSFEIFTIPLAMIQSENYFITVCTKASTVTGDFFEGKIKNISIEQTSKLMYQIMYNSSSRFLYYLRQIDRASDRLQKNLTKTMQNKEILQLLNLQKSLVFFSASLTANYAVIQKISNNINKAPKEEQNSEEIEILDDVIIENKQALEMCTVYREIIKSTMDAFASVVNNNMNLVMKFLTAITIILSIPMVVAGFWGMNTGVPFEGKLWGFWAAVGISGVISVIVSVIMIRKKMF